MKRSNRRRPVQPPRSAFAGFRFPPDVIIVAVRLYLRYNLSYRDVEELLLELGIDAPRGLRAAAAFTELATAV